jgi:hypothetical protein
VQRIATLLRSFGASTLRLTAFLERRFRATVTVRDRLLFDSTYVPPVKKPSSFVHLYAQLRSWFSIGDGPPVAGPQAHTFEERLRAATLMLSSPGVTPSDVARIVGYGSLDAMGRAFRDARLPAPSDVQAAVRYPDAG